MMRLHDRMSRFMCKIIRAKKDEMMERKEKLIRGRQDGNTNG
jgi:hypothetical protein